MYNNFVSFNISLRVLEILFYSLKIIFSVMPCTMTIFLDTLQNEHMATIYLYYTYMACKYIHHTYKYVCVGGIIKIIVTRDNINTVLVMLIYKSEMKTLKEIISFIAHSQMTNFQFVSQKLLCCYW